MEKKTIEKSTSKAIIFSLLICLGCAVFWGLVYSVGYITYIVGFASVALSSYVFVVYYKKFPFWACIMIIVAELIFTEIALFVSASILISNEMAMSFGEAFSYMFELIGGNEEFAQAILHDSLINAIVIILVGIFTWLSIHLKTKKEIEQQKVNEVYQKEMQEAEKARNIPSEQSIKHTQNINIEQKTNSVDTKQESTTAKHRNEYRHIFDDLENKD